jgi:sec-independent protein translocase protein TatC
MDDSVSSENDNKEMSLLDHLDELRTMLVHIAIGVFAGTCLGLFFSEDLLQVFIGQASKDVQFIAISPTEGFFTQLKLGILSGLVLSLPYTLIEFWRFVAPGLSSKEVRALYMATPVLVLLFIAGVSLAFFVAIPLGLKFLLTFQVAEVQATLSIEKYISFCFTLVLLFGTVFELPVFLVLLNVVGLVDADLLKRYRKHTIVGLFIVAALLTPPDLVTQCLVAIPMMILYEGSILVMNFMSKREASESQELGSDETDA